MCNTLITVVSKFVYSNFRLRLLLRLMSFHVQSQMI